MKKLLRNYLILSLIPLLLIVPGIAFGEELVELKLELDKDEFHFGEKIPITITPAKRIPNSDISAFLINEEGEEILKINRAFLSVLRLDQFDSVDAFPEFPDEYKVSFFSPIKMESGKYTIHVFYGRCDSLDCNSENYVGSGKKSFTYVDTPNKTLQFILDNYNLDKLDLGLNSKINPIVPSQINYGFDRELIIAEASIFFQPDTRNFSAKHIDFTVYPDTSSALGASQVVIDYESKFPDASYSEKRKFFEHGNFSCYKEIHSGGLGKMGPTRCLSQNLVIWFPDMDDFTIKPVLDKIDSIGLPPLSDQTEKFSNTSTNLDKDERTKEIASFVDQSKDPQSYIDRYKNEPKYKEWFDTNYPQYSSIYEAVGLKEIKSVEIVPEPTSISTKKVPDWVKNNAKWWSDSQVDDTTFSQGIGYLIKENIIEIDNLPSSGADSDQSVPEWVKNNAKWWADGMISEDEFLRGITYMVEKGIIRAQ